MVGEATVAQRRGAVTAALLVLVAFAPTLTSGFTNWDDPAYLTENAQVQALSAHNVIGLFTHPVNGNYNPLPLVLFAVEHSIVGLWAPLYHAVNLLLHIVCIVAVFRLAIALGLQTGGALVAALFFGIHPLRVESVAWVTERKDVLYGACYLGALLCYVGFLRGDRTLAKAYRQILPLFLLALLAKIQAVTFPLSLLVLDRYFGRPFSRRLVSEKLPLFALSLLFGGLGMLIAQRRGALGSGTLQLNGLDSIVLAGYSWVVQLGRMLLPLRLSALHPYPDRLSWVHYASWVVVPLLLWALSRAGELRRVLTFAVLFYTANIVFVLQAVRVGHAFLAERFTYIAAVGIAVAVGAAYEVGVRRVVRPTQVVTVMIVVGLSLLTWQRCQVWHDSEALWSDVIRRHSGVAIAYVNRGRFFQDRGDAALALADYNRALELDPQLAQAYNNRGRLFFDRGEPGSALADFERALTVAPDAVAYRNRAAVLARRGELKAALADLDRSVASDPDYADALRDRFIVRRALGRFADALADADAYLRLRPRDATLHSERGVVLLSLGRYEDATADFSNAIQLEPRNGLFYLNRAIVTARLGRTAQARADAATAQALGQPVDASSAAALAEPGGTLNHAGP